MIQLLQRLKNKKNIEMLTTMELVGSLEAHELRLERPNEILIENGFQSKFNVQSQKSKEGGRQSFENSKIKGLKMASILHVENMQNKKSLGERLLV